MFLDVGEWEERKSGPAPVTGGVGLWPRALSAPWLADSSCHWLWLLLVLGLPLSCPISPSGHQTPMKAWKMDIFKFNLLENIQSTASNILLTREHRAVAFPFHTFQHTLGQEEGKENVQCLSWEQSFENGTSHCLTELRILGIPLHIFFHSPLWQSSMNDCDCRRIY